MALFFSDYSDLYLIDANLLDLISLCFCTVWIQKVNGVFVWVYRYVQYNQTSLERNYKFDLLTEHDLGVPIDLINPDTYLVDHNG